MKPNHHIGKASVIATTPSKTKQSQHNYKDHKQTNIQAKPQNQDTNQYKPQKGKQTNTQT